MDCNMFNFAAVCKSCWSGITYKLPTRCSCASNLSSLIANAGVISFLVVYAWWNCSASHMCSVECFTSCYLWVQLMTMSSPSIVMVSYFCSQLIVRFTLENHSIPKMSPWFKFSTTLQVTICMQVPKHSGRWTSWVLKVSDSSASLICIAFVLIVTGLFCMLCRMRVHTKLCEAPESSSARSSSPAQPTSMNKRLVEAALVPTKPNKVLLLLVFSCWVVPVISLLCLCMQDWSSKAWQLVASTWRKVVASTCCR